jgi:Cation/multidrug efflux pump
LQKLAEICIRRPVFAAMLILALVVVGGTSYLRLGVDRFPSVDLPTVSIRTQLPGASAEEVETGISKRIEEVVNTVEGIDELRSISGPGASVVIVTFNLNREIDTAAQTCGIASPPSSRTCRRTRRRPWFRSSTTTSSRS